MKPSSGFGRIGDTTHLGFAKRGKKLVPLRRKDHDNKDGAQGEGFQVGGQVEGNGKDEKNGRLLTVHIVK